MSDRTNSQQGNPSLSTPAVPTLMFTCSFLVWLAIFPMSVSGHEGEVGQDEGDHSTHYELILKPGESKTFKVTWADQPLKARWIFLFSARVSGDGGATVKMYGPDSEKPFVSWYWPADGRAHTRLTELHEDGYYELSFSNSGASSGAVDISYQFDQSCECTGKMLDLNGGAVVFQQRVEKDEEVHFAFTEPDGADFFAWSGVRNRRPLIWKDGFDRVASATKSGKKIMMDYTAEISGTHYFFVESISGVGFILPEYSLQGDIYTGDNVMLTGRAFGLFGGGVILLGSALIVIVVLNKLRTRKTKIVNGQEVNV